MDSLTVTEIEWCRWLIAFNVSLIGGLLAAGTAVSIARGKSHFGNGILIGLLERLFFTIAVAFALNGVVTAMIAWIAAKMAAGWNLDQGSNNDKDELKKARFGALAGGLSSLLFALIGGLIANGTLNW